MASVLKTTLTADTSAIGPDQPISSVSLLDPFADLVDLARVGYVAATPTATYVGTLDDVLTVGSGITKTTVNGSGDAKVNLAVNGSTINLSTPPAIGGTTPNTGAFTSLSATGAITGASANINGALTADVLRVDINSIDYLRYFNENTGAAFGPHLRLVGNPLFVMARNNGTTILDEARWSFNFQNTETGSNDEGSDLRILAWPDGGGSALPHQIIIYRTDGTLRKENSGADNNVDLYTWRNGQSAEGNLRFYGANGTEGAETATTDNNVLGQISFFGHDGSSFITGGYIQMYAAENWSGSDRSTGMTFLTINGTSAQFLLRLEQNKMGFFGTTPITKPNVTGDRSLGTALTSLLTELANLGLITDSTVA